jgi:hypothetical protein
MLFLVQKTSQKCWVWNSRRFFAADRKNVIIIIYFVCAMATHKTCKDLWFLILYLDKYLCVVTFFVKIVTTYYLAEKSGCVDVV